MNAFAIDSSTFSEAERELLLELLERERSELPSEIRHCRVSEYREALHRKLETLDVLLAKVRAQARPAA